MYPDNDRACPLSAIGYRGVAKSEAAAIVTVPSSLYEFLLRHTRERVPHPAWGFLIQTCFGRIATARVIGNVVLI